MTNRILDFSESPVSLHQKSGLLVIKKENDEKVNIPFCDISVIVVSHPRITFTQGVMAGLASAGAVLVSCDEKYMPSSMMLPLKAHFVQGERFERQALAPLPTRKRLWRQIVKSKIRSQARLLEKLMGDDGGLQALADEVRSGDPENKEATAAQRYWPLLFNDISFRRDRTLEDQNRLLNYGYAVLRAVMARAVCAAGLHPSLGLHHRNRYNAFRLVDDLMEPFRPSVDEIVVEIVGSLGKDVPLDRSTKEPIIKSLLERRDIEGRSRTLFDAVSRLASSLAAVFSGERNDLLLPDD